MELIIGRKKEQELLKKYYSSNQSELLVVYGRRRVGKTFLIKTYFNNDFYLYVSGAYKVKKETQLKNFLIQLNVNMDKKITDWFAAFNCLKEKILVENTKERKIIFIDEVSWFDEKKSYFISAFEYFWNTFCSTRNDIMVILCGSSTSWITSKIFKNRGGLYNRLTGKMYIQPFTLEETEEYFKVKIKKLPRTDILDVYSVFGGIPYYFNFYNPTLSFSQNIDNLFSDANSTLCNEYGLLFSSLFENAEPYLEVINLLASKNSGLSRNLIIENINKSSGGQISLILENLELCGFIIKLANFPLRKNNAIYKVIDNFTLFYNKVIFKNDNISEHFWDTFKSSGKYYPFRGYAFENVCLQHVKQIKLKLGISGVYSVVYGYYDKDCQIDMLINRSDNIVHLCEIKYTDSNFVIDKSIYENIQKKLNTVNNALTKRKNILATLITVNTMKINQYSHCIENVITLDDFFKELI
jgi:AAA+ ATPase superfamily predicted ATPase